MAPGNGREPGRFVTHSQTRRMYLWKHPSEPGCGVTTLHRLPVGVAAPSAINALHGPMTALEHALLQRKSVLP